MRAHRGLFGADRDRFLRTSQPREAPEIPPKGPFWAQLAPSKFWAKPPFAKPPFGFPQSFSSFPRKSRKLCLGNRSLYPLTQHDGRNRAIVIAESLARVIAAIRIASVCWQGRASRKVLRVPNGVFQTVFFRFLTPACDRGRPFPKGQRMLKKHQCFQAFWCLLPMRILTTL